MFSNKSETSKDVLRSSEKFMNKNKGMI